MRTRSRSLAYNPPGCRAVLARCGYAGSLLESDLDLASVVPELDMYDRNWPIPPTMNHYRQRNSCRIAPVATDDP